MTIVPIITARVIHRPDSRELDTRDRCDRCLAQAYVEVTLAAGSLLFCGHHYRVHAEALAAVALSVDDQTNRLAS